MRRTGKFRKRFRTTMVVPTGKPALERESVSLSSISMRTPESWSWARVRISTRETEAMLGNASPRKPSVEMASRSSESESLLVAKRWKASSTWLVGIPPPSSVTRMYSVPPDLISICILDAPASSAFSTSSLTAEAGLSMTSPAAILDETSGLRSWMGMILRIYPGRLPRAALYPTLSEPPVSAKSLMML